MDITYKNNKIKKICTNAKSAEKTYGREMADKIQQRIQLSLRFQVKEVALW